MAVENGNVNKSDVTVLAARITGYGIETPPENGPNLSIYDETVYIWSKYVIRGGACIMITAKQQAETDQAIMEACKNYFYYSDS